MQRIDLTAVEVQDLLQGTSGVPQIIDVRTADEFELYYIKNAKNIDFLSPGFKQQLEALDRDRPYIVHCQSGERSEKALEVFAELGFRKVYHLLGGLRAWNDEKLPTVFNWTI